jgi:hypothetical protein
MGEFSTFVKPYLYFLMSMEASNLSNMGSITNYVQSKNQFNSCKKAMVSTPSA